MASTSDFRNGLIINHKNNLWKIIESFNELFLLYTGRFMNGAFHN